MGDILTYKTYRKIKANLNIAGEIAKKNAFKDPIWKIRSFLDLMNSKF